MEFCHDVTHGTNPDGEAALLAMIRERPGMTAGDVQVNAKMPRHTAYRYLLLFLPG